MLMNLNIKAMFYFLFVSSAQRANMHADDVKTPTGGAVYQQKRKSFISPGLFLCGFGRWPSTTALYCLPQESYTVT